MVKNHTGGAVLSLASTFFLWGSAYVACKVVDSNVSPLLIAFFRNFFALFPLYFMAKKYFNIKIDRQDWKYFIAIGLMGYYLNSVFLQIGIALTGASIASLLAAITPVTITAFAAIFLKEKITPLKVLCVLLAIVGTVIIVGDAGSKGEVWGIMATLFSVVCWSLTSVILRKLTRKYPTALVTFYGILCSMLFHIPTSTVTFALIPTTFEFVEIILIIAIGVLGTGIPQYTWSNSLSMLQASTCSLFYPLQPVFSAVLSFIVLKEEIHIAFVIGLLLVCADTVISVWDIHKHKEKHA